MTTEEKATVRNSIGRVIFVGVSVLLQLAWLVAAFLWLNQYSAILGAINRLVAVLVVLKLYGKHVNMAFKVPWMVLILVAPLLGLCLYFLLGRPGAAAPLRRTFARVDKTLEGLLPQDAKVMERLNAADRAIANQAHYIETCGGYPVYDGTQVEFYAEAEDGFAAQKEALRRAEEFIFMEYHAIEDGQSFRELQEILAQKAAQGVEVRLAYDDVGSGGFIDMDFIRRMEAVGIQCRVFNPLRPILNVGMNNRDHRKITVIDGQVGFTGGYNLADEYFNLTHPYGRWKDTGIKLTGDAVRSLTVIFLELWNAMKQTDTDYAPYLPPAAKPEQAAGFVQPYADSPLDEEYLGENVYLNLIKNAKDYIWFTTPYLIISDEMTRELGLAAKRGVDVRIITPGIPDKKLIYKVTRSYYAPLARDGVRIYEYTPGFIHAKQCLCDDEAGTVGTINMDYRSLYLHFENGVYLYGTPALAGMRADFEKTFPVCREVSEKYRFGRSTVLRVGQCLLRLFSPLM